MALRGDLKSLNLGNVLQDLAYNSQTGTLRLHVGERRRFFWFEKGVVRLVGLGLSQGPSICAGLLALGKISPSDLETGSRKTTDAARVNRLIREKKATNADAKSALENQMTELICDTFLWADAEFEFVGGEAHAEDFEIRQLDWEPKLACDAVTMEALRRVDEWTQIQKSVISAEEILLQSVPQVPDSADGQSQRLFALLDGERRLQDILNETHQGQFATFRAAAALLRGGWARALDVKEARAKAEAHVAAKRPEKALPLARFALSHEPHSPDLRKLAGRCLETLGKKDEAAAEYRILLAEEVQHGRSADAIVTCRKIIALAPKDTFTQEKLFQLLLDGGSAEEALAQGETLARALKRSGMPDRARAVYERLLNKFDESDEIMAALAEIAHHMGEKREAVTLYRKLFDRAVAAADEEMILERARTLLRLDPSLDDVARKRIEVETGMYRQNKARRRKVRFIITGCLVLGVVTALGMMEWAARRALRALQQEEYLMRDRQEFLPHFVGKYNDYLGKYAWTLAAGDAREKRNQFEDGLVDKELERARQEDETGDPYEALAIVDKVLGVAKSESAVSKMRKARIDFEDHRRRKEKQHLDEAAMISKESAVDRVKSFTTALAIPALQKLLQDSNGALRRAAVEALGGMKSKVPEATATLIEALADDIGELKAEIETQLRKRTGGKDHGPRPQDWEEWHLREQWLQRKSGPPYQGLVWETGPGKLEWRIVNISQEPQKLDLAFGPVFRVTWDGKELPLSVHFEAPAARRGIKATLKPGQFVGGAADLRALVDLTNARGPVRVTWSLKLEEGEGDEGKITSLPIRMDVKK